MSRSIVSYRFGVLNFLISLALSAISLASRFWILVWLSIWFNMLSFASAASTPLGDFPNIPFSVFSNAIESNFGSEISMSTVLTVLFTLIENPDLLNLHFRQQHPQYPGENKKLVSGWIIALVDVLTIQLGKKRTSSLFLDDELENESVLDKRQKTKLLASKLDNIANILELSPYNQADKYKGKLLPVSLDKIKPALVICPASFVCGTGDCKPRSLVQNTQARDIPMVTLVKNHTLYYNVPVLTGKCRECATSYSADHERFHDTSTILPEWKRVYLNSAKYIKIGSSLWVDRLFSTSVINAMYNFHASASAFAEYWNNCFETETTSMLREHIWQAFVQESVRTVAEESDINIELNDTLNIKEVTTQAYSLLGENGIIRAADRHACPECTQEYKKTSDIVFDNPAAVVGVDEDNDVPDLAENAEVPENISASSTPDIPIDTAQRSIKLVVLDGQVMGPQVKYFTLIQ